VWEWDVGVGIGSGSGMWEWDVGVWSGLGLAPISSVSVMDVPKYKPLFCPVWARQGLLC
jgi:hypothetical protein